MDGHQSFGVMPTSRPGRGDAGTQGVQPRSFLFLQGPISTFFDRLGSALIARGHRVHRINLHFGDRLFWRLPATDYRGRFEDWREFVGRILDEHAVTDLLLHGDRRPYHIVAAEEARARGIAVIATDLGYVRPDWITVEYDGMTTYSRFPRDPAAIRALAAGLPEPELGARFHTPFWLIAICDILYNLGLVLGRPLYPHYRYHSICHPFAEYAGWIWSRPKKLLTARATAAVKRRLSEEPGSYFLVPLQISTDFQIRAHSRFHDVREAAHAIIASFARNGSDRRLVFVVHPLDNGLIDWSRLIARLARQFGISQRVLVLHGGTPVELLRGAAGVVTINSTVGLTALYHGVPVKALGNAVFDIAGLTCQGPLDAFWHDPPSPDPLLMAAFLRALVGTTQVKGGYYVRASQDCAIAGFVERLECGLYPLPPLTAGEFSGRAPRAASRTVVISGVTDAFGTAIARICAAPGTRLRLLGRGPSLEAAADDCRHRGAPVEACRVAVGGGDLRAVIGPGEPVDLLVVASDGPAAPGAELAAAADVLTAMQAVAVLTPTLRREGGRIVLVSGLAGRAALADLRAAWNARAALVAYGKTLRRRLRAHGIGVAVVAPGRFALRLAAWLGEPRLTAMPADRLAVKVERGLNRGRETVAAPGPTPVALLALRLLSARLRQAGRRSLGQIRAAIRQPSDEPSLSGESGLGD